MRGKLPAMNAAPLSRTGMPLCLSIGRCCGSIPSGESVFAAAPVAMGLTDSHGVFVECNSELIFMLGMDPTGKAFQ